MINEQKEELTQEDLEEFLEWVSQTIEYVPLNEGAKRLVDALIQVQQEYEEEG